VEYRRNILLKIILSALILIPILIWFRLTPSSYETMEIVREVVPQEKLIRNNKDIDINKEYYTEEQMLVKKERTWIPFYVKTTDTIQTTGKKGWSRPRE
jgi:hypothetical protein